MEFFEPGIYYYSDHNFEEAAEYIGTVIVKPKQVEHFVELTAEGFNPGMLIETSSLISNWFWSHCGLGRNRTLINRNL